MLPFVAGQGDEFGILSQRFSRYANFGHFIDHHARHLVWRGLVQADVDLGVGLAQSRHGHGQYIARLGVGGGNAQGATVLGAELLSDAFEVADLAHDEFDAFEHMLARLGNAFEPLAMACKDFDAQFAL